MAIEYIADRDLYEKVIARIRGANHLISLLYLKSKVSSDLLMNIYLTVVHFSQYFKYFP